MKPIVRLLIIIIVILILIGGRETAVSAKQSLTGQDALNFLQETGIYDQLAAKSGSNYPPEGREFFLTGQIDASDGSTNDLFGVSVARDGDTVLIGAYQADINGAIDQGAAYVFKDMGNLGWMEEAKLIADDGAADDLFGFGVALDGNTAVIGAHQADIGGSSDQGAAYIFNRSGAIWSQTQKLVNGAGAAGDEFGSAVALDGETVLVGTPLDDIGGNIDQGGVYVYLKIGSNWQEVALLTAEFGAAGDEFGTAVALDGNTALVGAPFKDRIFITDQGAAYVFTGSGVSWSQEARLMALDGTGDDRFGGAVALDGNTALIGAHLADINGNSNQGAGYVFVREGGSWSQQGKIKDDGGAAGDRLGRSVAIEGDTALLGAPRVDVFGTSNQGAAYVYIRQDDSWSLQSRLTDWSGGDAGDRFGRSVALDGDTALIGSIYAGDSDQGAIYTFSRSDIPWLPDGEATANDGAGGDEFGYAVAFQGDRALVGAVAAPGITTADAGAAYIFERSPTSPTGWMQVDKLVADDDQDGSDFGYAVALDGDTALVGAPRTDAYGTEDRGLAYIFTKNGNIWSQQATLTSSSSSNDDLFGSAVALDGDLALVGSPNADPSGYDEQGAAFVFRREDGSWPQRGFLIAQDGKDGDGFGTAVALQGNTALVGAPNDTIGSDPFQGSAYLFTHEDPYWTFQAKLTAVDGDKVDFFGYTVALNETTAVIGAPGKEAYLGSDFQGAVYTFTGSGNNWSQQTKITAADGVEGDYFGFSLSLASNHILVGAPGADIYGLTDRGAVYLFVQEGNGWRQQTKLSAASTVENDLFGAAVALESTTILVGTPAVEVGGNSFQGKIYFFQRPPYEIFLPAVVR